MEIALAACIFFGTMIGMWTAIHYGSRWIDKQFELLPPELDGTKPIVLPYPPIREAPRRDGEEVR